MIFIGLQYDLQLFTIIEQHSATCFKHGFHTMHTFSNQNLNSDYCMVVLKIGIVGEQDFLLFFNTVSTLLRNHKNYRYIIESGGFIGKSAVVKKNNCFIKSVTGSRVSFSGRLATALILIYLPLTHIYCSSYKMSFEQCQHLKASPKNYEFTLKPSSNEGCEGGYHPLKGFFPLTL